MKSRLCSILIFIALAVDLTAADKQVLLIAGTPSHGPGEHEQNAAVLLLAKWLDTVPGFHATASLNGAWPDESAFRKSDAIFIFCDGAEGHLAFQDSHATAISEAAGRGTGLMFYHFAVEPPANRGHRQMLDWIGGFFELNHSVNPVWDANFSQLPVHPITRGIRPFDIRDEWYYNIHFKEPMREITGILVSTPPADTVKEDGIRSGNADVRSKVGQPEILVWAFDRPDGGRSVGFTGGHYHRNLGNENFRGTVLNSLVWIARGEVPKDGVKVSVRPSDLDGNLDPKRQPR